MARPRRPVAQGQKGILRDGMLDEVDRHG
jgi:hypothetical protein